MLSQKDWSITAIRIKRINFLIAGMAVLIGGLIYILCRPAEYSFFHWIRSLGFGGELSFLRAHSLPLGRRLPEWIIFSLPDGLWSFAYTLIILTIWTGSKSAIRYAWYASVPLLVIGSELLQVIGIGGTFCLTDFILATAGLLAGIATTKVTLNKTNHENSTEIQHAG